MKKLLSVWENTSKTGNTYYSGKLGEVDLIGFKNTNKTNPKAPDIEFYVKEEKNTPKNEKTVQKVEEEKDPFAEFGKQIEIDDSELPFGD